MKLKNMEKCEPDFSLNTKPAAMPGTSKYSSAQQIQLGTSNYQRYRNQGTGSGHRDKKPYFRKDGRR